MNNVVEAYPRLGKIARTAPLWQYDEGQIIHINGIELPAAYMAEFSNTTRGDAEQYIQQTDEITVPAQYLQSGQPVYIWLVIEDSESRTTVYEIVSPVALRSRPHGELIPEEQTPFDAALAALNDGVTRAEAAQEAAEGFAQSAEEDAHNAAQSASDAAQSASDAAQSASDAAQSARNASASEQSVAQNAESAQASASNAATSERNALASQQAAARSEAAAYAAMNNAHMVNFAVEDGFLVLYKSENLSDLTFELDNGNLVLVQEVV